MIKLYNFLVESFVDQYFYFEQAKARTKLLSGSYSQENGVLNTSELIIIYSKIGHQLYCERRTFLLAGWETSHYLSTKRYNINKIQKSMILNR